MVEQLYVIAYRSPLPKHAQPIYHLYSFNRSRPDRGS